MCKYLAALLAALIVTGAAGCLVDDREAPAIDTAGYGASLDREVIVVHAGELLRTPSTHPTALDEISGKGGGAHLRVGCEACHHRFLTVDRDPVSLLGTGDDAPDLGDKACACADEACRSELLHEQLGDPELCAIIACADGSVTMACTGP